MSSDQCHESVASLIGHLEVLSPGPITDTLTLEKLLADIWDLLDGSSEGGMSWYKLIGRIKDPIWYMPHLRFTIERHGAVAQGSSRAELQHWVVNPYDQVAQIDSFSTQQLNEMSKSLTKPELTAMALLVKNAIVGCKQVDFLDWLSKTKFRIAVSELIPTTNKQTTAGRRKRLRISIKDELQPLGWNETSPNHWSRGRS